MSKRHTSPTILVLDSDPLDKKLAANGIELIAPHRRNRRNLPRRMGADAFLLVGKDLLSHVVDHHGTFEVGYGWISAVLLPDE